MNRFFIDVCALFVVLSVGGLHHVVHGQVDDPPDPTDYWSGRVVFPYAVSAYPFVTALEIVNVAPHMVYVDVSARTDDGNNLHILSRAQKFTAGDATTPHFMSPTRAPDFSVTGPPVASIFGPGGDLPSPGLSVDLNAGQSAYFFAVIDPPPGDWDHQGIFIVEWSAFPPVGTPEPDPPIVVTLIQLTLDGTVVHRSAAAAHDYWIWTPGWRDPPAYPEYVSHITASSDVKVHVWSVTTEIESAKATIFGHPPEKSTVTMVVNAAIFDLQGNMLHHRQFSARPGTAVNLELGACGLPVNFVGLLRVGAAYFGEISVGGVYLHNGILAQHTFTRVDGSGAGHWQANPELGWGQSAAELNPWPVSWWQLPLTPTVE